MKETMTLAASKSIHALKLKRLGIDTHQEPVVYMRADCPVCRSEGFEAQARIQVTTGKQQIIATLNVVYDHLVEPDEVGLSEAAWKLLSPREGEMATFAHPPPVNSLSHIRAKIYGHKLSESALHEIIRDVLGGRFTDIQLSSFLTACASRGLDQEETIGLTRAMIHTGERIEWDAPMIMDKHCVGGLPGNRTTPIVVAIVAAAGLIMPKTSSRAITSPAGTADTMATLTNVDLDLALIRKVVKQEGGCLAWGGGKIRLSPADDVLIRVERAMDIDSEGQLVASILSKKAAAGSTHVVIDMPVGPTAKVRNLQDAQNLKSLLEATGQGIGLHVLVMITDGLQPVGRGIGPALEAHDVLSVLKNEIEAPKDLKERAILLAAKVIELSGRETETSSQSLARKILEEGQAWKKFQAICEAQGKLRLPPTAPYRHEITAPIRGTVAEIDNRRIAMVAKLAGAPEASAAGVLLQTPLASKVEKDEPLFAICAETKGELEYALNYVAAQKNIVRIEEK